MNWLDRTIAWLSPQAGMARVRARASLAVADRIIGRSYEGAKTGRRTQGWSASSTSANAAIETAGTRLRNRARDLVRNEPYAKRAIRSLVTNLVGTGIQADAQGRVGEVWKQWVMDADYYGELDFNGLQALVARAWFESGECLIVRQRLTAAETDKTKSGVPLKIKVLEADFLDTNKHGPQGNGNICIGGIELDRSGRRVGYWLYTQHPGDAPIFAPALNSIFVPARDVIHLFEKERPGQLRGVTALSTVILQLRDLNEYNEALLVKKKIEACFAAFVTTEEANRGMGTATQAALDAGGTQVDSAGNRIETLSPGLIEYLKPGEEVSFATPSSTAGTSQFESDRLRAIAMGADLTYEILSGDLSRVNFSSMRAGRQEFKTIIEQKRWLTFIPQFCARVQDWFEEAAWQSGKIRKIGYDFTWTPPRWEYVNPLQDVQTDKEELEAGLASWSAQVRKRGEDPAKVLAEIAEDKKRLAALGISLNFSATSATPTPPAGDTAPEPPEPPEPPGGDSPGPDNP